MAGWFVVNVADAPAFGSATGGTFVPFESDDDRFPEFGINIHVLWPGQANGMYHAEEAQEDFLVLAGECIAIVDGEERRLRAWDFVHCPAGTEHIFVGAGDGPCPILMAGARGGERAIHYPVSEPAARHGASVERDTGSPAEAYAGQEEFKPAKLDWPLD